MKKRFVCVVIVLGLLVCAAASAETKVLASIFPVYDIARQVAGEDASVSMLVRCGAEEHDYEPTPADIVALQECDVFFYIGGESDAWIDDILSGIDLTDKTVVRLMDETEVLREEGGEEDEYDEHIWTSPVKAMEMTDTICAAVSAYDESHRKKYEERRDAYLARLLTLDTEIRSIVENGKRKTILFGDRFPMLYFAKEYGLTWYAAFPGCSEETEPDVRTMAELIDVMRAQQLPVVFHIEMGNERVADAIAQETGAQVLQFHSCHNVTREEFDGGVTYLSIMEQNCAALETALY